VVASGGLPTDTGAGKAGDRLPAQTSRSVRAECDDRAGSPQESPPLAQCVVARAFMHIMHCMHAAAGSPSC
jgi:hypothetical protein